MTALIGTFGIATNNEYIIDGLISYSFCMDVAMGNFSMESLVKYGFHIRAANFVMLILFLSYLPVIAAAGVKAYRERDKIVLPKPVIMTFCCFAAAFLNVILEGGVILAEPLIPPDDSGMLKLVMMLATNGDAYSVFVISGILAPIVEEVVLRGGVQKSLQKINPVMAIIVASVIFGALHGNLVQGIFAGIFGLLLGYVYYKTDNLAYTIAMHMTVNLTGCLISVAALPEMPVYGIVAVITGLVFLGVSYFKQGKIEIPNILLPSSKETGTSNPKANDSAAA